MLFHKNIYKILYLFLTIVLIGNIASANAVSCQPTFKGNWIVEGNCDFPSGNIKVFGDIIVGTRTITVPTGVTLGVNLSVQKATFTTGKILFEGTGKMQDIPSGRGYVIEISYTAGVDSNPSSNSSRTDCNSGSSCTACPTGWNVINTSITDFQGSTPTIVSNGGKIRCGKL